MNNDSPLKARQKRPAQPLLQHFSRHRVAHGKPDRTTQRCIAYQPLAGGCRSRHIRDTARPGPFARLGRSAKCTGSDGRGHTRQYMAPRNSVLPAAVHERVIGRGPASGKSRLSIMVKM